MWSPRHLEDLGKFPNLFIKKKLFNLPNNTPGYAIRHETGMESIGLTVFKLILNLTAEYILKMTNSRLTRVCFFSITNILFRKKYY